jgi:hypothetical protein
MPSISSLNIQIDGTPVVYSSTSNNYYWFVSFTYSHSTHNVDVTFGPLQPLQANSLMQTQQSLTSKFAGSSANPNAAEISADPVLIAVIVALSALLSVSLLRNKRFRQSN